MRGSTGFVRAVLAVAIGLLLSMPAAAQLGRVNGTVRNEDGQPLKGATVVAENAEATPSSFTAVTNEKGQFMMIGLWRGTWRFTASAPGFVALAGYGRIQTIGSNPPVEFRLVRAAARRPAGVLAGVNAGEAQAALAGADALMDEGKYDEAIAQVPRGARHGTRPDDDQPPDRTGAPDEARL